jgi:hypothetical protein
MSTYEDGWKGLQALEKDTVEFKKKLIETNRAALELIDSLELVAGKDYSVDNDGLIKINSDSLKQAQEREIAKLQMEQANKAGADLRA